MKKFFKRILYLIMLMSALLMALLFVCAWNPEMTQRIAQILYPDRQAETEALTVGNLPLGIFQQVEVQPVCRNLQDGDYVIMVSDGVVDAFEEAYEDALLQAVEAAETQNPGGMAEWLLRAALRAGKGRVKDDMTIGVIGIWEVCP